RLQLGILPDGVADLGINRLVEVERHGIPPAASVAGSTPGRGSATAVRPAQPTRPAAVPPAPAGTPPGVRRATILDGGGGMPARSSAASPGQAEEAQEPRAAGAAAVRADEREPQGQLKPPAGHRPRLAAGAVRAERVHPFILRNRHVRFSSRQPTARAFLAP